MYPEQDKSSITGRETPACIKFQHSEGGIGADISALLKSLEAAEASNKGAGKAAASSVPPPRAASATDDVTARLKVLFPDTAVPTLPQVL